jgi:hypothetical protein
MSTPNTEANKTVYPKYSISVSNSGVTVEAPTKKECLALFNKVKSTAIKPSDGLQDAIR